MPLTVCFFAIAAWLVRYLGLGSGLSPAMRYVARCIARAEPAWDATAGVLTRSKPTIMLQMNATAV